MDYLDFLRAMHTRIDPKNYLEIGVRWGQSLGVSRCRSVGIDPAFAIDQELHAEVHLFRTTSDEYFARPRPLAPTGGEPFDLVFIDGLHLFEFALRDFIHAERHSRPSGAVLLDDILPRRAVEANREIHTSAWTGDVYSMVPVLAEYRPDLLAIPLDTQPTGLLLVLGLDPGNTTLADRYHEIITRFRKPDPQPVPAHLIDRTFVQSPHRVLDSPLLDVLGEATRTQRQTGVAEELRSFAVSAMGPAYAAAT